MRFVTNRAGRLGTEQPLGAISRAATPIASRPSSLPVGSIPLRAATRTRWCKSRRPNRTDDTRYDIQQFEWAVAQPIVLEAGVRPEIARALDSVTEPRLTRSVGDPVITPPPRPARRPGGGSTSGGNLRQAKHTHPQPAGRRSFSRQAANSQHTRRR